MGGSVFCTIPLALERSFELLFKMSARAGRSFALLTRLDECGPFLLFICSIYPRPSSAIFFVSTKTNIATDIYGGSTGSSLLQKSRCLHSD